MSSEISVRRLGEEEWATYRRVRLDALKEAPYAFGSTYAGEKDRTEADWRKAVGARARFVAEVDGAIVGTVSIADSSYGGAADVTAMWVDPRSRGVGVGDLLIRTVVDWAKKQGLAQIFLWVATGNEHAEVLYARNGFVRTGEATTNEHGKHEFEMKKQL